MRPASVAGVVPCLTVAFLLGCAATEDPDAPPAPGGPSAATVPATNAPTPPSPTGVPSGGTGGTTATPGGGAAVPVTLVRSGGFTGRGESVTVRPDGRWTAVDEAGSRRGGQLDPGDLDRLRRLVADPGLVPGTTPPTPAVSCNDTYSYRLVAGAAEIGWTDCPDVTQPPRVAAAIAELLLQATG